MQGYVHSFESLAAVDGEGLRCAVFLSGCPMRCIYCHNPDTWEQKSGTPTDSDFLAKKIARYKPYFKDDGGVTFSGGEPLCQAEFINETAKLLKEDNISYVVDTSGCVPLTQDVKTVLQNAQHVILDIKFWDDESYRKYAGHSIENVLNMLEYISSRNIKLWVRTVIVPGINDKTEILDKYLSLLKGKNIDRYELLPFHTMGFFKYEKLGVENRLLGTKAMQNDEKNSLQTYVNCVLDKNISNNC